MRKAFFRRVTTRWAASSLARAASDRNSGFGVSCSKYSTRHGHQSASISAFGKCIRSFKLDARLQIVGPKSSRLFVGMLLRRTRSHEQEITPAVASAWVGREMFFGLRSLQARQQILEFILGNDERVEAPGVPLNR